MFRYLSEDCSEGLLIKLETVTCWYGKSIVEVALPVVVRKMHVQSAIHYQIKSLCGLVLWPVLSSDRLQHIEEQSCQKCDCQSHLLECLQCMFSHNFLVYSIFLRGIFVAFISTSRQSCMFFGWFNLCHFNLEHRA